MLAFSSSSGHAGCSLMKTPPVARWRTAMNKVCREKAVPCLHCRSSLPLRKARPKIDAREKKNLNGLGHLPPLKVSGGGRCRAAEKVSHGAPANVAEIAPFSYSLMSFFQEVASTWRFPYSWETAVSIDNTVMRTPLRLAHWLARNARPCLSFCR